VSTNQLRSLTVAALTIGLGITSAAPAFAQQRAASTQPIQVRWLGHATFEVVSSGGTRILIDPWLAQNPSTPTR
jgi:hypothetical protein